MRNRILLIAFEIISFSCLYANEPKNIDSNVKHKPYFSIQTEFNFMKVTSSDVFRAFGMNGGLQANYYLKNDLYVLAYLSYMGDMSPRERFFQIESKVYDLSSSKLIYYGLGMGYNVWKERHFTISTDLRVGLGHYTVNEIFQNQNNGNSLKKSILMIMPRSNFSYRIGKFEPGISFSYIFPSALNGDLKLYDLNNFNSGVYCKYNF